MKTLYTITGLILLSTVALTSCRNADDIPEDIHEHEEIEKMTLSIVDQSNTNDTLVINYIGGVADQKINLETGKTYSVDVDFLVGHDGHYHSIDHELEEEKDEHFITYDFAGVDIELLRRNDDIIRTDGKKLGLKTQWKVTSVPVAAKVNIRLYHGASSVTDVYPSVSNQWGSANGGSADVNAWIDIE